jgi:hypothetical protein
MHRFSYDTTATPITGAAVDQRIVLSTSLTMHCLRLQGWTSRQGHR